MVWNCSSCLLLGVGVGLCGGVLGESKVFWNAFSQESALTLLTAVCQGWLLTAGREMSFQMTFPQSRPAASLLLWTLEEGRG